MTIETTAFSDYFQALAAPRFGETPRIMVDMEEAAAFHAEMRAMAETLRLNDLAKSGCNRRMHLLNIVMEHRGYQYGQATMALPHDHEHTFECAAYGYVQTGEGVQRVAFNPLRAEPELWPVFEQRCAGMGYVPEWSIISDNMGGKRNPSFELEMLHNEECDPVAP